MNMGKVVQLHRQMTEMEIAESAIVEMSRIVDRLENIPLDVLNSVCLIDTEDGMELQGAQTIETVAMHLTALACAMKDRKDAINLSERLLNEMTGDSLCKSQ